jgi:hypothetical protein
VQISSRDVNTRVTKHNDTCTLVDQNIRKQAISQEGKPKDEHDDLFVEIQQLAPKLSTSLLRKFELLTKANSESGLFQPLSSIHCLASFLVEVKRTFTNFPMAHHNLESSRTTPSHLGGLTSKSNWCSQRAFSLHPKLDFLQITQTSSRGVGES